MPRLGPRATTLHGGCHELGQSHSLNDQIDEWRVLKAVQLIFAAKLDWTIRPERGRARSDGAQKIRSENRLDWFTTALYFLPFIEPAQTLSCRVLDDCLNTLADVLELLDSLVDDRVLDADAEDTPPKKEENPQADGVVEKKSSRRWRPAKLWAAIHWPKNSKQPKSRLSTKSVPPSTTPASTGCEPTRDNTTEYPKLQALGKIFRESDIEGADVFRFCSNYIVLEQATEVYAEASKKLGSFFRVWGGLRQLDDSDSRHLFPLSFPATKWRDTGPTEFALQLFDALNERVSECLVKHTVLLQLNGFQFEGESVSFDAFFSC